VRTPTLRSLAKYRAELVDQEQLTWHLQSIRVIAGEAGLDQGLLIKLIDYHWQLLCFTKPQFVTVHT